MGLRRFEIAHDDDPGWVFGELDDGAALFQADVLPEYRDSWAFLRDRAPEYPDEFQVGDLDGLAAERPLLVGLDFGVENVREILGALPHVRGPALTLGERARRGGVRFWSYPEVVAVVEAVRGD